MKNAWIWLKEHARLVGVIVVAILGAILGGAFVKQLRRPDQTVKRELKAIDAGNKAAQDAIANGVELAVSKLKEQHATTIAALDESQKAAMDKRRQDPRAMAAYLTKMSG